MTDKPKLQQSPEAMQNPRSAAAGTPLHLSWPALYSLVLGELVLLIVLFYAFSKLLQ